MRRRNLKTTTRLHLTIGLGAAVLLVALLAGCGGGGGGGNAAPSPTVNFFTATPTALDFPGGTVMLSASISSPNGIVAVTVNVHSSDGTNTAVKMTSPDWDLYSGHFTAPPNVNSSGTAVDYSITLTATDTKGNSTRTEPITVTVTAPDPPLDGPK